MQKTEFKDLQKKLIEIAQKYRWNFTDIDTNTFRCSFVDVTDSWHADVYLSKLTVCLSRKGTNPKFLKKRTWEQIDKIFSSPRLAK